jgi:LysM repeat protein
MQKASAAWKRRLALTVLVCVGLLLAACTRSANPTNLPPTNTSGPDQGTGVSTQPPVDGQNATMAAISTEVASQLTQTAVALGGAGGGDETAIVPPTNTVAPPVEGATATTAPGVVPTATPIPPVVAATTAPPPVAGAPCPNPYTVQQGDWIYKIARNCGVAPSALIAANPGINPNAIKPGQLLNMPVAGATPVPGVTQAVCTGTHTVVTGDTLFRLAYNCGLTVEQLAAANGIIFPYTIFPGQILRYP